MSAESEQKAQEKGQKSGKGRRLLSKALGDDDEEDD